MAPRTIRLVTPLLVALLAALGVVAPVLGAPDGRTRGAGETGATITCCGDDCRCGTGCPCVERDSSGEPTHPPLANTDARGLRALCLAAPTGPARAGSIEPASGRASPAPDESAAHARPAGRELLARVSKWTT